MQGYFRGLLPRILRKGMGSIIAWSFYEYLIDKKDAMIFTWVGSEQDSAVSALFNNYGTCQDICKHDKCNFELPKEKAKLD